MKTEILEMALETLKNKVQELKEEVKELREKVNKNKSCEYTIHEQPNTNQDLDELLTIKQVQKILGVCYNTLQKSIVKKGLLVPKKISERKIRFSKRELIAYMNNLTKSKNHE